MQIGEAVRENDLQRCNKAKKKREKLWDFHFLTKRENDKIRITKAKEKHINI